MLIFCTSKMETERIASIISDRLLGSLTDESAQKLVANYSLLVQSVEYFKKETKSTDETLLKSLGVGVGFHHAGEFMCSFSGVIFIKLLKMSNFL